MHDSRSTLSNLRQICEINFFLFLTQHASEGGFEDSLLTRVRNQLDPASRISSPEENSEARLAAMVTNLMYSIIAFIY